MEISILNNSSNDPERTSYNEKDYTQRSEFSMDSSQGLSGIETGDLKDNSKGKKNFVFFQTSIQVQSYNDLNIQFHLDIFQVIYRVCLYAIIYPNYFNSINEEFQNSYNEILNKVKGMMESPFLDRDQVIKNLKSIEEQLVEMKSKPLDYQRNQNERDLDCNIFKFLQQYFKITKEAYEIIKYCKNEKVKPQVQQMIIDLISSSCYNYNNDFVVFQLFFEELIISNNLSHSLGLIVQISNSIQILKEEYKSKNEHRSAAHSMSSILAITSVFDKMNENKNQFQKQ